MNRFRIWAWIVVLATVFAACDQEENEVPLADQDDQLKRAIFSTMKDWYYWNNELPSQINTRDYATIEDLLEALRFRPLDRFTYFTTPEARANLIVGNVTGVHGIRIAFSQDDRLFLASVTKTGPAGQDGWQRGWEILEINGQPIIRDPITRALTNSLGPNEAGVQNTFKFRLPDGTTTTRTIPKASFTANSVVHEQVYEMGGKKIGYWAYENFRATQGMTGNRSQEVEDSFRRFQEQNINELIIDLRYNRGGLVSVAEQILNILAPSSANGQVMYQYRWNPQRSNNNFVRNFTKEGNLNLNRIVFITSQSSASASELVINSMRPFVDVVIIGDNTFGKPVGSIGVSQFNRNLVSAGLELELITFSIANARGDADYFEGFEPNVKVGDDLTRNWGDPEEWRLAAALNLITNGSVGSRLANTYYRPQWHMHEAFKGLEQEYFMY